MKEPRAETALRREEGAAVPGSDAAAPPSAAAENAEPAAAEPPQAPQALWPPPGIAAPRAPNGQGSLAGKLRRLFRRVDGADAAPTSYRDEDVTPVPPLAPGEREVSLRAVRPPYAFVRVVFEEATSQHRYEVIEPPLSAAEAAALAFTKNAFLRTLDVDLGALDAHGAREYLRHSFEGIARRNRIDLPLLSRARVAYYLERDFLGYGAIDAVMHDPDIEDISCDGPRVPLFIYRRGTGSLRSNVSFATEDDLDGFVIQLVQRSGKHISVADPLVDATLPDGSRLQASLSREVTTRGSTFTIRKFREDPFTPVDLLRFGTASPELMAFLWLAVENGASALICGGTASGKTTTLNALSLFIPRDKKVVSIEDTREINLPHENWIPGVTRAGGQTEEGGDGKRLGEVDMFDLLKAALRQRPEYLIVGEVRGREAYVLFQAMATGHTVYSTMHADSVSSAVYRLESKPLEVPRMMLSALDVVLIQGETRIGERRVRKIREAVEITGIDPKTGEILTNRVFSWDPARDEFAYSGVSFVLGRIAEELNWSEEELRAEFDRRLRILTALEARGIRDLARVSRALATYATDPDRALAEATGDAAV